MNILYRWLRKIKSDAISEDDTADIPLYEVVAEEIKSGIRHEGTWAKAFAEANGDKDKARAIYIKLRVAQLPHEIALYKAETERYKAEIARSKYIFFERVREFSKSPIQDMSHIPSQKYYGSPKTLSDPITVTKLSEITGLLEFEIIDLIKLEKSKGVRSGEEWFVDKAYFDESY